MASKTKEYYLSKITAMSVAEVADTQILTAEMLYPFIKHYGHADVENFLVVTLSGTHKVLNIHEVTRGIVNKVMVHPREVFRRAITDNAVAIIVAHNHPSGHLVPSDEDKAITRRLKEAGELIGITVLDHLILSRDTYISFVEDNWF